MTESVVVIPNEKKRNEVKFFEVRNLISKETFKSLQRFEVFLEPTFGGGRGASLTPHHPFHIIGIAQNNPHHFFTYIRHTVIGYGTEIGDW